MPRLYQTGMWMSTKTFSVAVDFHVHDPAIGEVPAKDRHGFGETPSGDRDGLQTVMCAEIGDRVASSHGSFLYATIIPHGEIKSSKREIFFFFVFSLDFSGLSCIFPKVPGPEISRPGAILQTSPAKSSWPEGVSSWTGMLTNPEGITRTHFPTIPRSRRVLRIPVFSE